MQQSTGATEISTLHSRASSWFESQGLIAESIEHALAAGDVDRRAAETVERFRYDELDADRWYVVEKWLAKLPADVKSVRPGLLLAEAWAAFFRLRLERMASILERVESLYGDQLTETGLLGEVDYFRGYLSYWSGEGQTLGGSSRRRFCGSPNISS